MFFVCAEIKCLVVVFSLVVSLRCYGINPNEHSVKSELVSDIFHVVIYEYIYKFVDFLKSP